VCERELRLLQINLLVTSKEFGGKEEVFPGKSSGENTTVKLSLTRGLQSGSRRGRLDVSDVSHFRQDSANSPFLPSRPLLHQCLNAKPHAP